MIPLSDLGQQYAKLTADMAAYDPIRAAAYFAGLMTEPKLQASVFRLEVMVHLILMHASGRRKLGTNKGKRWFFDLNDGPVGSWEDPPEDVFVSHVCTSAGDFQMLLGVWSSADFYLQRFTNVIESMPNVGPYPNLKRSVFAMLRLTDAVAKRSRLRRYQVGTTEPIERIPRDCAERGARFRRRVRFSISELKALDIDLEALGPFVFSAPDRSSLGDQTIGNTSLERRPLIHSGEDVYYLLPTAASIAIRHHIITTLQLLGVQRNLERALAEEYSRLFSETPLLGGHFDAPFKFGPIGTSAIADVSTRIDDSRVLHFVAFVDGFAGHSERGFLSSDPDTRDLVGEIKRRVGVARKASMESQRFREGMSLVVGCGWGRGSPSPQFSQNERWRVVSISAPDLVTLSWLPSFKPAHLWKLLDALEAVARMGVTIQNVSGLLNLYAWSRQNEHQLIPPSLLPVDAEIGKHPIFVMLPQNSLLDLRREVREMWDEHQVPDIEGQLVRVRRESATWYFTEDERTPSFVAFDDVSKGRLRGIHESEDRNWWCEIEIPGDSDRDLAHLLWTALFHWLSFAVPVIERRWSQLPKGSILWTTSFVPCLIPDIDTPVPTKEEARKLIDFEADPESTVIKVSVSEGFLASFNQPTNVAERELVRAFVKGVAALSGDNLGSDDLDAIVAEIVPDKWARNVHFIHAKRFRDFLRERLPDEPIIIESADNAASCLGIGWMVRKREDGNNYTGIVNTTNLLNDAVESIWQRMRELLNGLERAAFIKAVLLNHEAIMDERSNWMRTARAVLSLHADTQNVLEVASKETSQLNGSSLASRILVEMAVCECPLGEGGELGALELLSLMSDARLIHDYGGWSDAIHCGIMPAEVRIAPLGDLMVNSDLASLVMRPLVKKFETRQFESEAERYGHLYEEVEVVETAEDIFGTKFCDAFLAEYGVGLDKLRAFIDCLEFKGMELKQLVYPLKQSELLQFESDGKFIEQQAIEAILNHFRLWPRKEWSSTPEGFENADWYPWRFRRRLSLVSRPLVQIDEGIDPTFLIAPSLVRDGVFNVIQNCREAGFDEKKFHSKSMRTWIGHERNRRGNDFNNRVADQLKKSGWQTKASIGLPEILNSKLDRDYGDVDVLAWLNGDDKVFAIECKDLEFAKTYGEVAGQISRFRGEVDAEGKPDELRRHLSRCRKLEREESDVAKFTKLDGKIKIEPRLVFSRPTPVALSKMVGLEQHKILTIDELNELATRKVG